MASRTRRTGHEGTPATAPPDSPFQRWEARRRRAAGEAKLPSSSTARGRAPSRETEDAFAERLEAVEDSHETVLPPGPSRSAVVQSAQWVYRPVEFMQRCREEYGPVFRARLGPLRNVIFLSDPAYVKAILTGDPELLRTGDINGIFRPIIGDNSILVLDGPRHMQQRRLLLPPFHGRALEGFRSTMEEVTERELARWPSGERFAVLPRMHSISTEIVLEAVLGIRGEERRERLRTLLPRFLDLSQSTAVFLPFLRKGIFGGSWRRLMSSIEDLDRELYEEIGERRRATEAGEPPGADVLSLLVAARHEDGSPIGDEELRDELVTLLVAGHETTSGALALAIEEIVRYPKVIERMRAEKPSGEERYADAVVAEALRRKPVLPIIGRKLTVPARLGAYVLPKGTVLMPCAYLLHHEASLYPDPGEFRPERFFDSAPGTYTWIPFGGGIRRCVGARFAQLQMKVVLKAIFDRLDVWPASEDPEKIRRRSVSLAPSKGGELIAQPRRR